MFLLRAYRTVLRSPQGYKLNLLFSFPVLQYPTRVFLDILGYEKQEYKYLDYNAPEDAPQDLFKEE